MRHSSLSSLSLLASIMLVVLVQAAQPAIAVTYQPGVKAGDWWQYGDVTGYCPNPCQIIDFASTLTITSAITRVTSVTGTNVSETSTISYANGTVTSASYSGDLSTGLGNLPDGLALIAANLSAGDPIFNSAYAPILNSTILATYAGAVRQVNIWNTTSTAPKGILTVYFDKLTGIDLGTSLVSSAAFLSFRVTGTSLWPYKVAIRDDGICVMTDQLCKFDPANITIDKGTTVEWNNTGMIIHTVTSCSGNAILPFGCPLGADLPSLPSFTSGIIYQGHSFSFTFNIPGNYSYYCSIHPWMHGTVQVRTDATNARTNPPTIVITSLNPNPASTTETVTTDFNVKSNTTVSAIEINWGDGTTIHLSLDATSATHSYATTNGAISQTYTINLTATNSAGQGFAVAQETINDRAPTIEITSVSPLPANTGKTVTVNFSARDPDGTISSITVNWGDGSSPDLLSGSAKSDTHAYNRAGSFTITITVTDNSGSSSHISNQSLTITSPPAPASPTPTILGLNPIEFDAMIGIAAALIATATLLVVRRIAKPTSKTQSQ